MIRKPLGIQHNKDGRFCMNHGMNKECKLKLNCEMVDDRLPFSVILSLTRSAQGKYLAFIINMAL